MGIDSSDMAKELGISYSRYKLIENGDVKMPTKLMDKFNEIVNKGSNNHKLERLENEKVVNDFWNEMSEPLGTYGDYKLKEKMKEFNIKTFAELGKLVNIGGANLSHYLKLRDKAPYSAKNRIYLFFQDELNIQPTEKNTTKMRNPNAGRMCHNKELIDWYNDFDMNKFMEDNQLNCRDLAKKAGLSISSIQRMASKRIKLPSEKTISIIKNYVDSVSKINEEKVVIEDTTIDEFIKDSENYVVMQTVNNENKIVKEEHNTSNVENKYKNELDEINEIIDIYKGKMQELEIRAKVCEEVLKVINEIRNEG